MTLEAFEYVWENGIKKAAHDIRDNIKNKVDNIEVYEFVLDDSNEKMNQLYSEYDRIRLELRRLFFDTGVGGENKIDSHKICACITGALLNVRLFTFSLNNEKLPQCIIYANYTLAFLAGVYVMYLLLLADYKKNDNEKYEYLKKKACFEFPKTNFGHDDYLVGRIKTLALNDISGNYFDVLTYADMLFWIETYNKNLIG